MDIINFSKIAAPKFEFGCGFYFCVIGALKYIIGKTNNVHLPQRGFESFRKKFTIHIRKDSNRSSSY